MASVLRSASWTAVRANLHWSTLFAATTAAAVAFECIVRLRFSDRRRMHLRQRMVDPSAPAPQLQQPIHAALERRAGSSEGRSRVSIFHVVMATSMSGSVFRVGITAVRQQHRRPGSRRGDGAMLSLPWRPRS